MIGHRSVAQGEVNMVPLALLEESLARRRCRDGRCRDRCCGDGRCRNHDPGDGQHGGRPRVGGQAAGPRSVWLIAAMVSGTTR